jgi:hypothetical protein
MQEHIIKKEDGSEIKWSSTKDNRPFCLLYKDNNQKYKFTPTENLTCELFMIGGGGAGGYFFGGGGGAGASYINNNYTFKKNKTYTFEIGSGGMCDIIDINELFKSGLNLNIYNNTDTDLSKINFMYDDYSSLGIQNSGMMQSFNVNNITIPSTILNNNTTYIWDGYIKTNSTGYFNISVNSKMNTVIWLDKFVYTNANALIEGNNINDVKIVQLESNRFYNIKIIVYNYNITAANNNFNISFKDCEFFNFNKTKENYKYEPATDTILTYKNDDNTFETIKCKGGGNGGCGFYNKNTNLDGGCGGGSGINKIKGSSIIEAIYNGNDGASGDYCGGGGGIISPGNNNKGGSGKIIEWFNSNLIFGAGGNAANLTETRNLGYGCGGNGGECCYYSKLLINNNGNNGCILIYVKSNNNSPPIKEGFAVNKDDTFIKDNSIAKKLIEQSFKISTYDSYATNSVRNTFFTQPEMMYYNNTNMMRNFNISANTFILNSRPYLGYDNGLNQTFIYDMLILSKLFAIIYRLYWHHFNNTLQNDNEKWATFIENSYLNFENNTGTNIDQYRVNIKSLNTISSLSIKTAQNATKMQPSEYNNTIYVNSDVNMTRDIITAYVNNSDGTSSSTSTNDINYSASVPLYHYVNNGGILPYLGNIADELTANNYYDIHFANSATQTITNTSYLNASTTASFTKGRTTVDILDSTSFLTRASLKNAYTIISADGTVGIAASGVSDNYLYQRAYLYMEAFNIILNTDPTYILSTLKYYMHYYNLVVYNVSIQYGLTLIQNNRSIPNATSSAGNKCISNTDITNNNLITSVTDGSGSCASDKTKYAAATITTVTSGSGDASALNTYLDNLTKYNIKYITDNLNNSSDFKETTANIITASSENKETSANYYKNQSELNSIINDYNGELENYNTISFYYKLIIAFGILLAIVILFVFGTNSIDNNSKISVNVIIIILIIIAFIVYKEYSGIKEKFTVIFHKDESTNVGDLNTAINKIVDYKFSVDKYINKLLLSLGSTSIGGTLKTSLQYINRLSVIKNEKAELFKIKKMNLLNSIEILKKTSKFYYYMIILIFVGIIIFNIALIMYLINPNMIIGIIIYAVILFVILIYYVAYNIHKSTRLAENKNYWANYNPSDLTISNL